ncbi:MAG: hypothetical protein AAF639_17605, partial [Chloroflexota bacterium]
ANVNTNTLSLTADSNTRPGVYHSAFKPHPLIRNRHLQTILPVRLFRQTALYKNAWGIQCHPEKSHTVGLRILRNFMRMVTAVSVEDS